MVDYLLLCFLSFYGIKGTLILNSSCQQNKIHIWEKKPRKTIQINKTGKTNIQIQILVLYFEV